MDKDSTKMFMAHLPIKDISNVVSTLLEYSSVGNYIVCCETTPYEHIHFLVEMNEKDYNAYAKRVFIKQYKLRGRALKDKPRQYGKVKEIKNMEKALSYTLKDQIKYGNHIYTNMETKIVMDYLAKSYKKEERKPKIEKWIQDNEGFIEDTYSSETCVKWITSLQEGDRDSRFYMDGLRYSMLKIFSKMRADLGHVQNMRKLFYDVMLKHQYISMEYYCSVIYRV